MSGSAGDADQARVIMDENRLPPVVADNLGVLLTAVTAIGVLTFLLNLRRYSDTFRSHPKPKRYVYLVGLSAVWLVAILLTAYFWIRYSLHLSSL